MSTFWLLAAKQWPDDQRSKEATTCRFTLRPGTYTVGRHHDQCDIPIIEDKSISRLHATITVPEKWADGETPHVLVKDSSRYGTLVSDKNELDHSGEVGTEQKAEHRWLIKFGYQSPFRISHLDWGVVLHPTCAPSATAAAVEAGFAVCSSLEECSGPGCLVMPGKLCDLDALVLDALALGRPIVSKSWLTAWTAKGLWRDADMPSYSEHGVKVHRHHWGEKNLHLRVDSLRAAVTGRVMNGVTLLWKKEKDKSDRDLEPLRRLAERAGAESMIWPDSEEESEDLPVKAVVVLRSHMDASTVPYYLLDLKMEDYDTIMKCIFYNERQGVFKELLAEEDNDSAGTAVTGGAAGRRKRTRQQSDVTPTKNKSSEGDGVIDGTPSAARKTRSRAGAAGGGGGPPSVAHTEVIALTGSPSGVDGADAGAAAAPSGRRQTRSAASGGGGGGATPSSKRKAAPSTAVADSETEDEEDKSHGPAPSKRQKTSTRGRGRGRGGGSSSKVSQEDAAASPGSVHASPAKRRTRRQSLESVLEAKEGEEMQVEEAAPAETPAPAPAPVGAAARATQIHNLVLSSADGWHTTHRTNRAATLAPEMSPKPRSQRAARGAAQAPRARAAAEQPAAAATPEISQAGGGADNAEETAAIAAEDLGAVVLDQSLIVAPHAQHAAAMTTWAGGPNFKAFKRKGDAVEANQYTHHRRIIGFNPEPYREGAVDNEDFLRDEAERLAAAEVADALFDTELKAPKRGAAAKRGRAPAAKPRATQARRK